MKGIGGEEVKEQPVQPGPSLRMSELSRTKVRLGAERRSEECGRVDAGRLLEQVVECGGGG